MGEVYLANADCAVPCIEDGYFTVQHQSGKGYVAEAARAACRIAFERLGVRRVELQCAADNEKSARVALRCGFTLEGRLRECAHKKDSPRLTGCGLGCCAPSGRTRFQNKQRNDASFPTRWTAGLC